MLRVYVFLSIIILFSYTSYAQSNNDGNIEPVLTCPLDLNLCIIEMTDAPTISTASDLPNTEYFVINPAIMATNGSGSAIVGVDIDGMLIPSDFGIMPGGTLEIIPVSYDLSKIQNTIDDILKGLIGGFIPCCLGAGTTCADLNNAGINCGSDVMSIEHIFPLINNTGDLLSVTDFGNSVTGANTQLGGAPPECGGGDFIAYAYGNSCIYTVYNVFEVISVPDHTMSETIERSDFIESTALVSNGLVVNYFAGNHVELLALFEVQLGGEFLADINLCQ